MHGQCPAQQLLRHTYIWGQDDVSVSDTGDFVKPEIVVRYRQSQVNLYYFEAYKKHRENVWNLTWQYTVDFQEVPSKEIQVSQIFRVDFRRDIVRPLYVSLNIDFQPEWLKLKSLQVQETKVDCLVLRMIVIVVPYKWNYQMRVVPRCLELWWDLADHLRVVDHDFSWVSNDLTAFVESVNLDCSLVAICQTGNHLVCHEDLGDTGLVKIQSYL